MPNVFSSMARLFLLWGKLAMLFCTCRYDFTDGDLSVSLAQLHEYLDTYEAPPYRWVTNTHFNSMPCTAHDFASLVWSCPSMLSKRAHESDVRLSFLL